MSAKKTKKVQMERTAKETQVSKQPHKHTVKTVRRKSVTWIFPLEKKNLIWLAVGLGVIVVGYILMASGITDEPALPKGTWNNPIAISVAPVLLVIGYCVLIPLAILKLFKKEDKNQESK